MSLLMISLVTFLLGSLVSLSSVPLSVCLCYVPVCDPHVLVFPIQFPCSPPLFIPCLPCLSYVFSQPFLPSICAPQLCLPVSLPCSLVQSLFQSSFVLFYFDSLVVYVQCVQFGFPCGAMFFCISCVPCVFPLPPTNSCLYILCEFSPQPFSSHLPFPCGSPVSLPCSGFCLVVLVSPSSGVPLFSLLFTFLPVGCVCLNKWHAFT